ncbi:MAG: hydroxymethylpyrimidine/phosphomethylpyrimidine kinase, partial [Epulopiscium sp. Nele67-Bin002]
AIIEIIAAKLKEYNAKNIVIDPVMVSTSGHQLISEEAKDVLVKQLLPLAAVITPNIAEAEMLCGFDIKNENDMIRAAEYIETTSNVPVLVKGGHLITHDAIDLLYSHPEKLDWYRMPKVDNENTHGTGCTLSAAIACNLAAGEALDVAVKHAKEYLTKVLKGQLNLGEGRGPLNHAYLL